MKASITKYLPAVTAFSVLISVMVVLYIIYKKLVGDDANDTYNDDINTNQLTYNESQYYIFADSIQSATQGSFGDDEEAIYNIFSQMQNNSDVLQLILAFGNRSYISPPGIFYNASLNEVITTKMEASEIQHINEILASNGITVTF